MKPEDAEAIGKFVADMIHAGGNDERQGLVEELKHHFSGKPGSGECICEWSPEVAKKHCEATYQTFEVYAGAMSLDHRCPKHGEKAQPALWGRHKGKTLCVTPAQWLSLGVEYK